MIMKKEEHEVMMQHLHKEVNQIAWKMAGCCRACWFAKGKRCKCRCNGRHHGSGLIKKPTTLEEFKQLSNVFPKSKENSEKVYRLVQEALKEHPDWAESFLSVPRREGKYLDK
jgi:hypothetical protein